MINTLVSYDDQDIELGPYFELSNNTLRQRINNPHININELNGENCTMASINLAIANYTPNNFIFIAFSHGDDDALITNSERYVTNENSIGFCKSFFYSSACSCGDKLGPSLIDNECHSFIGYTDEIHVHPDYHSDFIDCEIHAIVEFINGEMTIGDSYLAMHEKYDEVILRLSEGNIFDTIVASTLVKNKRHLRILGNKKLTVADFHQI